MRQIDTDMAKQVESTSTLAQVAMGVMVFFFLLILLCMGPLLPTWMFLNSMQLIFHVPLIKSDLPSHAFYFMIEYLDKLRLHSDWTK